MYCFEQFKLFSLHVCSLNRISRISVAAVCNYFCQIRKKKKLGDYTTCSIDIFAEIKAVFSNKDSVQKEVKAAVSQKATLSCEVSDLKTEVKWYKDGKLLTSTKTLHTESKGKTRQLVINSVEKKDAGEYICEAGTEKLAFRIHVAGK